MNKLGKLLFLLIVAAVVFFAYEQWGKKRSANGTRDLARQANSGDASTQPSGEDEDEGDLYAAPEDRPAELPPPQAYIPKDNTLDVELSEYAGYSGLILANGGLAPSEDSYVFKKHGVKLRITLSEEDSWPALQSGKLAASSTTADVLPLYGRKFDITVPAQFCFSRGADGVVVRRDIRRINDLKGRILATPPFNESEFFIRYLAQEANLPVARLNNPGEKADPNSINLVFCEDAEVAAEAFAKDVASGGALAGCVSWAPFTGEAVKNSGGKAHLLVDNKNLLIIADVLLVNKGFAKAHPKMVEAMVDALIWGNSQIRQDPKPHVPMLARTFKWTESETAEELSKVHLSNLPENQAFFSGSIDSAGSYDGIYQSSILAYGPQIILNPTPSEYFQDPAPLAALAAAGAYAGQTVSIQPIKTAGAGSPIENDPLLTRDIRFLFQPNSADLDMSKTENHGYLESIRKMLGVSPGSMILLQGHVDDARVADFRKQGGEPLVRQMALKAIELSKNRANEVKRQLLKLQGADPIRVEIIGRGWEDPKGLTTSEEKRRVEVLWYTVE